MKSKNFSFVEVYCGYLEPVNILVSEPGWSFFRVVWRALVVFISILKTVF